MRGINKVILIGTLGQDPELRYGASGNAMASLSVATNESWKDKQTGEKQERTEWHRVKLFGRTAEIAGEYLRKGGAVYIEGKLRTEKYTDKEGVERYSTSVYGDEIQLLGGAKSGDGDSDTPQRSNRQERAPAKPQPAKPARASAPPAHDPFDDQIPF